MPEVRLERAKQPRKRLNRPGNGAEQSEYDRLHAGFASRPAQPAVRGSLISISLISPTCGSGVITYARIDPPRSLCGVLFLPERCFSLEAIHQKFASVEA